MPNTLQKAQMTILDNAECLQELKSAAVTGNEPEIFDSQVCTGIGDREISACSVSISGIVSTSNRFLLASSSSYKRFPIDPAI